MALKHPSVLGPAECAACEFPRSSEILVDFAE